MFGFGKTKPFAREEFADAVADVRRRMTEGDYVSGSQAAAALRRSVEKRNGPHTLMWGEAHLLEARVAMMVGDFATGLEHMRAAADVHGDDDEVAKARFTAQMNLGQVLSEMGASDEAEEVLRANLEGRRAFYGADEPGFGYGAESLSTLLLTEGRYEEAARLAKQASDAYREGVEAGRRETALLLWLTAEKALRPESPALDLLEREDLDTLLPALADATGPRVIDALVDLRWEIYGKLTTREAKMDCLAMIAHACRPLERHDDRIRALKDYIPLAAANSEDEAAHALQGLALAYDEAGRDEEALAAYEEALTRADAERPNVLRNAAIYLGEHGQDERAEALFQEGMHEPEGEPRARLAGAYGIFLHHRGRFDEAMEPLRTCVENLHPSHPDRLIALAHVDLAARGEPCTCARVE